MGEYGTMSISELTEYNQIYREAHAEPREEHANGEKPVVEKNLAKEEIYHKFWEQPAPWRSIDKAKNDKWLSGKSLTDARVSKGLDPWEIPSHTQFDERPHTPHLRNFFETVRDGGSQDDLYCPAIEGFRTTVTCMKIHDALANGGKLEFKPEEFEV